MPNFSHTPLPHRTRTNTNPYDTSTPFFAPFFRPGMPSQDEEAVNLARGRLIEAATFMYRRKCNAPAQPPPSPPPLPPPKHAPGTSSKGPAGQPPFLPLPAPLSAPPPGSKASPDPPAVTERQKALMEERRRERKNSRRRERKGTGTS